MQPILHNYFRSSTSHRVRTALALKGVSYDYAAFHLRKGESTAASASHPSILSACAGAELGGR